MSNIKLVRRFCTVLSALGRSLDMINKYGEVRNGFQYHFIHDHHLPQTPLHLAVKDNKPGIVSELLKRGAAPEVTTVEGDSSYHLAVHHSSPDCLSTLTRYTANNNTLNMFNHKGKHSDNAEASDDDITIQD